MKYTIECPVCQLEYGEFEEGVSSRIGVCPRCGEDIALLVPVLESKEGDLDELWLDAPTDDGPIARMAAIAKAADADICSSKTSLRKARDGYER